MAITQNPLIGQASGSAGGLTFQYYQRKNVLRRKPFCPRDPATPAQIISRNKLKDLQITQLNDGSNFLKMLCTAKPRSISKFEFFKQFIWQYIDSYVTFPESFKPSNKLYGGKGYTAPTGKIARYRPMPNPYQLVIYPFGDGSDFPDYELFNIQIAIFFKFNNTVIYFDDAQLNYAQSFIYDLDSIDLLNDKIAIFVIYRRRTIADSIYASKCLFS